MISFFESLAHTRPGFHLSILVLFLLLSIVSLTKTNLEVFPARVSGTVIVTTQFPGADVNQMEAEITFPLEEVLSSVGGVSEMRSITEAGRSEIRMGFQNTDKILHYIAEIREKIERVSSGFSREVRKPTIESSGSSESPAMVLSIQKDGADPSDLRRFVQKQLKAKMETDPNVGRVIIVGGEIQEILISSDRDRLEAEGLTIDDLIRKIKSNNTYSLVSSLKEGFSERGIFLNSKKNEPSDFARIPLSYKNNGILYLRDVASIEYQPKEKESFFRRNGKEGLSLYIYPSFKGNLGSVRHEIEKIQNDLQKEGIRLDVVYDRHSQTKSELFRYFLFSILLFLSAILFCAQGNVVTNFLTMIPTFVIASGIFNLCFGSINALFFISLNVFTLVFLFLPKFFLRLNRSQGLYSFLKKLKLDRIFEKKGGILFFQSIWTLVIFLLLRYEFGLSLIQIFFGITIFFLVWNFTISTNTFRFPGLSFISKADLSANHWFQFRKGKIQSRIENLSIRWSRIGSDLFEKKFFLSLLNLVSVGTNYFKKKPTYFLIFSLCTLAFILFYTHKSYTIRSKRQTLLGMIELPPGTGVLATDKVSKKVEELLIQSNFTEEIIAKVEKDHSRILIRLKEDLSADGDLILKLKKQVGKQSPAFVYFTGDSEGNRSEESTFEILGSDSKEINSLVQQISKEVTAFPETEEVVLRYKGPREELIMNVDPGKSSQSLLDASRLGEDLRLTLQGGIAAKAFLEAREFDVRVRANSEFRGSKDSIEKIHVRNSENKFVPLGEVTFGKEDTTPVKVFHKNRTRYLSFSIKFREKSSDDTDRLENKILSLPLPSGYRIEKSEHKQSKIFGKLGDSNFGFYFFVFVLIFTKGIDHWKNDHWKKLTGLYTLKLGILFLLVRVLLGEWKLDSFLYFISLGLFL
ncbi:efflux RND transporter permease subunit [Leptospira sp. 201903071]|uniref:efflux RND transporter permease subunit n=1 Tax=Leptospira ainazelensis TaxID=2810034 RepID=UPI0019653BB9|nr:efflux RND transporter permease subunit [Leptospira ainazelensis]MBM9502905.1 efflux RND transporter permease subunit [Leptospira ainazelensis]